MILNQNPTHRNLLFCLYILLIIGIVMVYSSSYLYSKELTGNSTHFFLRQLGFAFLGVLIMGILGKTKFSFWYNNAIYVNIFFTLLLFCSLIPGIGVNLKGAQRWIDLKYFFIQPGEFVKYSTILFSTYLIEKFPNLTLKEKIIMVFLLFLPLLFLILQPDFGAFSICLCVMAFLIFLSPFPRKWFYGLMVVGGSGLFMILFLAPYRVQRILTFLDPWKDPRRSGFQIIQSYLAFANGSLFGKGIGNSNEKLFYLPEAHNDFILSVIGEEFGLIGVAFVVFCFLFFIYFGLKAALEQKSPAVSNFMAALIFLLGLQATLNMGVVLGLLPTKGLNLPFISYGGSSMLSNCCALGLFFAAAKETQSGSTGSYFSRKR